MSETATIYALTPEYAKNRLVRSTFMTQRCGFTQFELLIIGMALAVVVGILLPILNAAHRNRQRMDNMTRLRGIHQGCIQYAHGNNEKFPGLEDDLTTGDYAKPRSVSTRMQILFDNKYFKADFIISPIESSKTEFTSGAMKTDNFSYSMLDITEGATNREEAWSPMSNSKGALISDRSKAIDPSMPTTSIHVTTISTKPENWRGGVTWNDNHVTFETSAILEHTRYGELSFENDDIFIDNNCDVFMAYD